MYIHMYMYMYLSFVAVNKLVCEIHNVLTNAAFVDFHLQYMYIHEYIIWLVDGGNNKYSLVAQWEQYPLK